MEAADGEMILCTMSFGPPNDDLQVEVTGHESTVTYEYSRTPTVGVARRIQLAEEFRRWSAEERTRLGRLDPIGLIEPVEMTWTTK